MEKTGKTITVTDVEMLNDSGNWLKLKELQADGWLVMNREDNSIKAESHFYLERGAKNRSPQRANVWRPAWCQ